MSATETSTPDAELHAKHSTLRDVVGLYMKNQLPHDLHPSFERISDNVAEPRLSLPTVAQTTSSSRSGQEVEHHDSTTEDDENISLEELYEDAEMEKSRFASAMEEYEKMADPKYKTKITAGGVHTWEQVLEELDKAATQDQEGSRLWKKIRRGLHKFGDSNKAFDAWLELLPTQSNYCSIICGGLKLILKAASRLRELRESTCDALAEIPALLKNTQLILRVFKKSKELQKCSSALYVSTLGTLEHMMTWYKQKAAKKAFKVFFKQDAYERDLTEKLCALKLNSDRFAEAAKICSYQKLEVIDRGVERARRESTQNYNNLSTELKTESTDIRHGVSNIGEGISSMDLKIAKIESNQNDLQVLVDNLPLVLKNMLGSSPRLDQKTHDIREPVLPKNNRFAKLQKQRIQIMEEALILLNHSDSVPLDDIRAILKIAWTLPRTAQDRAVALMQAPQLHAWITSTTSSALLVNGNHDASARESPLSFVCAKLVDSIHPTAKDGQTQPVGIMAYAFFCGHHLNSKDPDSGIPGMLRSLITQFLLGYADFDLATVRRLRQVDPDNVKSLCEAFAMLVAHVPENTMVFCIIDAITFHEDSPARCKEAQKVVQMLLDTVDACGEGSCIFKILLTSPGNSRALYRDFAKGDVIWMARNVPSQGGFTSMKWTASAGRDMGGLVAT